MTLRAKPVVKGPGRSGWNSDDRKTFLTNLAFVLSIVVSILLLIGYAGFSWYSDHLGAAATVDGVTISRDDLRQRTAIEDFRIKYTESRIRTLQAGGRLSEAAASSQLQFLAERSQNVAGVALERLIDSTVQSKLATEAGISISDAEIDAQLVTEATIVEQRHVFTIEITPAIDPATGKPSEAETAAAKATAEAALAKLTAGTSWDDVAKTTSDAISAAQNGDLGWLPEDSGYDKAFMTAVFTANVDEPTDVIEGEEGVFRIGRVTEVAPSTVDQTYSVRLDDAGIKPEAYREVVRADLVRTALDDKIVADLSKPSLQRHVAQIYMASGPPQPEGVKVRHILISPNHDPAGAAELPADDPAWAAAEEAAQALYTQLLKDPTQFDELARTKSDEQAAISSGGKLPYFDRSSQIDTAFGVAIFAPGLEPGQLIPPFKSSFGWHVVQFMHRYDTGDADWMAKFRTQLVEGADFAAIARDQGEGPESAFGGDIDWVAKGQLSDLKEGPIFATAVDGLSDVVTVPSDGVYLWKILGEEMRTPTKDQIATFESDGFNNWYAARKAAVTITRDTVTTGATE
ncbi:MAG: peptidylprolyl isomerase [Candidatus Limnocylindrales bacterium]